MARRFTSTNKIDAGTAVASFTTPITISCWYKDTDAGSNQSLVALYVDSSNFLALKLQFNDGATALYLLADANGHHSVLSGSINAWHHGCGVFTSTTSRTVYLDGVAGSTDTFSVAPTGTPDFIIGFSGSVLTGSIADVAIWNVALNASEIAALARGVRPNNIRTSALIGWWPLDGLSSPEPDLSGNSHNGTLTGTALANGPPVTLFTPKSRTLPFLPAATTTTVPWPMFGGLRAA